MRRRNLRIVTAIVAAAALALFFQNCGQSAFSGVNSASSLDSLTVSATDNSPFAYDATYDEISYNSCFGAGATPLQGFHTIMAGAYDSGGVWVTNNYFAYANANLKPIYPATTISPAQLKGALSTSPTQKTAVLEMALREVGTPQSLLTLSGNIPALGTDFVNLLGDLNDDRWLDPLVTTQANNMYFNLAPVGQRSLEGSLAYTKDSATAQAVRNGLNASGMLALTFGVDPSDGPAYEARPVVSTNVNIVEGRGYIMHFAPSISPFAATYVQPIDPRNPNLKTYVPSTPGIAPAQNNPEQLTYISEVDLRKPSSTVQTWTCSPNRQYVVVRAADAYDDLSKTPAQTGLCPADPFSYLLTGIPAKGITAAQYRREMEVVRRHLPASQWDVNIERRCVVPKKGSCYTDADNETYPNPLYPPAFNPPTTTLATAALPPNIPVPIEYDQTKPCFRPDIPSTTVPVPIAWCAQYVSFCTRGAN